MRGCLPTVVKDYDHVLQRFGVGTVINVVGDREACGPTSQKCAPQWWTRGQSANPGKREQRRRRHCTTMKALARVVNEICIHWNLWKNTLWLYYRSLYKRISVYFLCLCHIWHNLGSVVEVKVSVSLHVSTKAYGSDSRESNSNRPVKIRQCGRRGHNIIGTIVQLQSA